MSFRSYAFLALLAGVAAALGHAPFGFWWLALPGFAALIWLAATQSRSGWITWFAGVGYFGVALHWIVEPFLVDIETHGWMAPGAILLLAGGLAIFWALSAVLAARLSSTPHRRALAFVVCLTAAEVLRGHIFTGFPWAMPAYIWADTSLRGVVALTGSYGLTGLTLLCASLPTLAKSRVFGAALAGAGLMGLFLAGQSQLSPQDARDLGIVRLVQPNVPQSEKWQRDKVPDHLERLMDLTRATGAGEVDMVVWPEAAVVYPLDQAGTILAEAATAAGNADVVLGINRREGAEAWFNSLVVVGANGAVKEAYDKVHLVPFGEYIPFRIEFLRAMAASSGFGFTAGDAVRLIDTPLGRALPLICYEGIFPRHIFRAEERADYILLITNDAWFGTFSGPYQHLDQARFRATEHGLPVVRVANTGVSTVISRYGEVTETLDLGVTGYLDQVVSTSQNPTFYARTGDWPLIGLLLLSLSALILLRKRNGIANSTTSV